jgi:hypothetical protein
MKTKNTLLLAAITFGLLSVSAWAQPATVRYISGHDQAFWITNNTDKTLSVTLTKIEILVGTEWQTYSQPTEPGPGSFYFMHPNINRGWLTPHEAGYGRLLAQSISLPKDGVWRARVIVEEQLTGQEATEAAAKTRGDLEAVAKLGHSVQESDKIPSVAYASDRPSYWGHPVVIYGEEVRPL